MQVRANLEPNHWTHSTPDTIDILIVPFQKTILISEVEKTQQYVPCEECNTN